MQDQAVRNAIDETNCRRPRISEALPADISILAEWQEQIRSERKLAPLTTDAYGTDTRQFADFIAGRGRDLSSAQVEDVEAFISHSREIGITDRSLVRKLAALRRFYRWMFRKKRIDHNPTAFLQIRKNWSDDPRSLTEAVVNEMLDGAASPAEHLHPWATELRDSAILETLYGGGIRASELAGLNIEGCDCEAGVLLVRGKGDKERYVVIPHTAKIALEKYLSDGRPDFPRPSGSSKDAVFLSARGKRLSRQWVWKVVKNANPDAYPHRLRHSCASHMLAHGAKLDEVQEILGHKRISTTTGYTQSVSPEQLEKTFRQCHPRAQVNKR